MGRPFLLRFRNAVRMMRRFARQLEYQSERELVSGFRAAIRLCCLFCVYSVRAILEISAQLQTLNLS
jgi:hypothetical protein